MASMRNRYAVTGTQPPEIMPLHRASEALADGNANNVDILAGEKMGSGDFRTDRQQGILGDAKLAQSCFRFDFRLGEVTTLRLCDILGLCGADAELQCCV